MTTFTAIKDDLETVVGLMKVDADDPDEPPFFMAGRRAEINARLIERDKGDASVKERKYPLIVLIMDIPEPLTNGDMINYNLHLAIVTFTDKVKNSEERIDDVIVPTLYPIYALFLEKIVESGLFTWPGDPTRPDHQKFDRPFWGDPNTERNESFYFSDPVDAIEIVNLRLNKEIC